MKSQPQRDFALDAVLGHGLLAGARQTLVLHGALPDPSAPAARSNEAQALIQQEDAVLTTSYLVPQLSQRNQHRLPQEKTESIPQGWPLECAAAQSR